MEQRAFSIEKLPNSQGVTGFTAHGGREGTGLLALFFAYGYKHTRAEILVVHADECARKRLAEYLDLPLFQRDGVIDAGWGERHCAADTARP